MYGYILYISYADTEQNSVACLNSYEYMQALLILSVPIFSRKCSIIIKFHTDYTDAIL